MRKFALTLDLKNDPELIKEYEEWHTKVWPEVLESIRNSGILKMTIYRMQTRLFMLMEVRDTFSFEAKALAEHDNLIVQEWEELMWKYQQKIPGSKTTEKWLLMDKVFEL
jgi:L-rhamnose mutarotase